MGKLTTFIGGQYVTVDNVTEERQLVRTTADPSTFVDGTIYITNS